MGSLFPVSFGCRFSTGQYLLKKNILVFITIFLYLFCLKVFISTALQVKLYSSLFVQLQCYLKVEQEHENNQKKYHQNMKQLGCLSRWMKEPPCNKCTISFQAKFTSWELSRSRKCFALVATSRKEERLCVTPKKELL